MVPAGNPLPVPNRQIENVLESAMPNCGTPFQRRHSVLLVGVAPTNPPASGSKSSQSPMMRPGPKARETWSSKRLKSATAMLPPSVTLPLLLTQTTAGLVPKNVKPLGGGPQAALSSASPKESPGGASLKAGRVRSYPPEGLGVNWRVTPFRSKAFKAPPPDS